jgi:Mrp family chromosome partitioning ATPase
MSKIEDALKKASSVVVLHGTGRSNDASRQLARTAQPQAQTASTAVSTVSTDLAQRASSRAEIARMNQPERISEQDLARNKIIYPEMEDGRVLNAFRELRTKIIQKSIGGSGLIMVTGVGAGAGASFVARNLAAAFAFDASKTALLLDCNLKNPQFAAIGGDGSNLGLTDYLESDDVPVEKIIHPAGIDRFRLIPSGAQCEVPAEYFTSLKMSKLLTQLKQRYPDRYIVLDTPPITESADTSIVAELCDHVLLVVPHGKVTAGQVEAAGKAVGLNKLVGVVFNNEPKLPWARIWKAFWARRSAK